MHSKSAVMLDFSLRQTLLAGSDLFRGLPDTLIRYVATHAVERRLDDRDVLYLKNEALDFIALVVEGQVYSVLHGPDGREQIVGSAAVGQVVGESALVEGHVRETSAFACGPTRVLLLGRRHFRVLYAEPLFWQRVLMLLMARLMKILELLELVCLHRLESRLARFLLANLDDFAQAPMTCAAVPRNQGILAAMLNTSRPKLNVQLQDWRRSGLISSQSGHLVINDVEHLRRKACSLN
ncbi:Crp/Fnr family transcriptional regulator [Pseudomonas chlororaphis]|uniref:Transcriptional regulator n=1 Tax=Pseudomonas chlororaphis TaxID=587753 RepID=A0A1Q8EXA1_9PSED|nr:Crp/Fnr family transcriptional regulator [Pseudomonas chlororaphis]OLF56395.1 transcriptional regulator [Pseudomonas chlororaphis]